MNKKLFDILMQYAEETQALKNMRAVFRFSEPFVMENGSKCNYTCIVTRNQCSSEKCFYFYGEQNDGYHIVGALYADGTSTNITEKDAERMHRILLYIRNSYRSRCRITSSGDITVKVDVDIVAVCRGNKIFLCRKLDESNMKAISRTIHYKNHIEEKSFLYFLRRDIQQFVK